MTLRAKLAAALLAKSAGYAFMRGSIGGFAVRVTAILSGLGSAIVLARVLEPAGYGIYAYAYAIIALVMVPVQLGLPTLILRETARANATENWALLRGIWRWSSLAIAIGSIIAVCGVAGWLLIFKDEMLPERYATLLWGLPLIPLMALSAARASALSGLRLPVRSHFTDQVLRPVVLSVLLLGGLAFGTIVDPARAMMFHTIAATLAFAAGALLLTKARPAALQKAGPCEMKHKEWIRALIPLSALTAVQIINQSADLIMLGYYRSDAEVGIYRIAVSSATLAGIGLTAMSMVFSGHIADAIARDKTAALQNIVSAAALVCTLITLAILAGFALFGGPLLGFIFGPAYTNAYSILVILSVAQLVSSVFCMNGRILILGGYEHKALAIVSLSVAINIGFNALLIPSYGGNGAAIAMLASTTVWNVLCWASVYRVHAIDTTPFGLKGYLTR